MSLTQAQLDKIFDIQPSSKTVFTGKDCPKCGLPMRRKGHPATSTKHLRKRYYFSQWDYCRPCRHIQHYPEYLVRNS